MKTLYLVIEDGENKIDKQTESSIIENLNDKDELLFVTNFSDFEFENAYCKLNQLIFKKDLFDYICIIPNGSLLTEKSKELVSSYKTDSKTILLPLIVLENKETKGVLNSSLFNSENAVYGSLEQEDLNKHLDVTLYGAYIPYQLILNEEIYNKELKIYQHYYMIKKLTELTSIKGVPKISMILKSDLSYNTYSKEEKINCFKQIFEIKN